MSRDFLYYLMMLQGFNKSSRVFRIGRELAPLVFFCLLALIPFWIPLFDGFGTLQWDAREVHLTNLYFSSRIWQAGALPLWTPFIFNGFPQIADMQVAVFYPINLLIGFFTTFGPRILFAQIVFHYALAGFGMYLFVRHITRVPLAGLFSGVAYMFSGFLIGHATHVGMQNTAAWIPIVLLLTHYALEKKEWIYACAMGFVAGIAILAGHFQTAVFMLFAVGLYALFLMCTAWWRERVFPWRQCALMGAAIIMMSLIAAVQLIPTLELTAQSQRASISLALAQTESLAPDSLHGLVTPNYHNVAYGNYTGPWDRTQNYLFLGITTLFLALTALIMRRAVAHRRLIWFFTVLGGIAVLYAIGQYGFIHQYFYLLPLFGKMRAPSNMMIVFDVAVVVLAGIGLAALSRSFTKGKLFAVFAVAVIIAELMPYAILTELTYARKDPATLFEKPWIVQDVAQEYAALAPIDRFRLYRVPELSRNLAQVFGIYDFGGYNPLALMRQATYEDAMVNNPALIDLGGIKYLPCEYIASRAPIMKKVGNLCMNESYVPRAFVASDYSVAANEHDALTALRNVNIKTTVVLEKDPALSRAKGEWQGTIVRYEEKPNQVLLTVRADAPAPLVIGQTYYPGWTATVNGESAEVLRADYLYQAVIVPKGESTVVLSFMPRSLKEGLILSIIGVILFLGCIAQKCVGMIRKRTIYHA